MTCSPQQAATAHSGEQPNSKGLAIVDSSRNPLMIFYKSFKFDPLIPFFLGNLHEHV